MVKKWSKLKTQMNWFDGTTYVYEQYCLSYAAMCCNSVNIFFVKNATYYLSKVLVTHTFEIVWWNHAYLWYMY